MYELPDPRPTSVVFVALLAAAGLTACGDDPAGPSGDAPSVSLSVALAGSGADAAAARGPALAVTQTDGAGNELTVDRVALVLSEIELEVDDFECPDEDGEGEDDDCAELESGPRLLDFEPDDDPVRRDVLVQQIPDRFVGRTFTELEFEIEVPDDDEGEDPDAFLGEDVSVLVEGVYNGDDFTYVADLEAEQERPVSIRIDEGVSEVNVTLRIALDGWFRTADGTLVDPATALEDGPNEELVEENVEDSFDAFEDDDHDGEDDEDGDDGDEDGED